MSAPDRNYILLSDVHLGADLVHQVRPRPEPTEETQLDRDLVEMIAFYRRHADPERPWCMIAAGDLVDFVGMCIPAEGELETELDADERVHGLGSSPDHAAAKMRAVARRHAPVFRELSAFVGDGHSLVLVRGNHDLDFHWDAARAAFVDALVAEHLAQGGDPRTVEALRARVEFHPWFYYVEGLLYVEHGHQLDAMCQNPRLLFPLRPTDHKRLELTFSDLLLRLVARPTPGLTQDGHQTTGLGHYLRLAWNVGLVGGVRLGYRFLRAVVGAIRIGRARVTEAAQALRQEHERAMASIAERTRVGVERIEALAGLWPRPVTRGVLPVLRAVFLDRVLLFFLVLAVLAVLPLAGASLTTWLLTFAGLTVGLLGYSAWSTRVRTAEVDPEPAMRRAAERIAELLPTRFVVMGHTHQPAFVPAGRATYVNLGYWGVDDADGDAEQPPCTHLVVRFVEGEPIARLMKWLPGRGPESF